MKEEEQGVRDTIVSVQIEEIKRKILQDRNMMDMAVNVKSSPLLCSFSFARFSSILSPLLSSPLPCPRFPSLLSSPSSFLSFPFLFSLLVPPSSTMSSHLSHHFLCPPLSRSLYPIFTPSPISPLPTPPSPPLSLHSSPLTCLCRGC